MKVKTIQSFDPLQPTLLTAEWSDGNTEVYTIDDMPDHIIAQLAWHGLKQKMFDAHAGAAKNGWSVAECRQISEEVYVNLQAGSWGAERSGSGGWIIEAIADVFDVEVEDARETWSGFDEETKKAVRNDPKIKAWKAERELAKAQATESKLDVSGLFTS